MVDRDIELKVMLRTFTHSTTQLGANLTLFKCHEPLSHTYHKLLHQINED